MVALYTSKINSCGILDRVGVEQWLAAVPSHWIGEKLSGGMYFADLVQCTAVELSGTFHHVLCYRHQECYQKVQD